MTLKDYENMAWDLLEEHGLTDLGWSFSWNRTKRILGRCKYNTCEIQLSMIITPLRDPEAVIRTIYHELAHALTPGAHHGVAWQRKFAEFGYEPTRCSQDEFERPYTWVMKFGDEVVRGWYRRPNKSTFERLSDTWLKGRKDETYGKLTIEQVT